MNPTKTVFSQQTEPTEPDYTEIVAFAQKTRRSPCCNCSAVFSEEEYLRLLVVPMYGRNTLTHRAESIIARQCSRCRNPVGKPFIAEQWSIALGK